MVNGYLLQEALKLDEGMIGFCDSQLVVATGSEPLGAFDFGGGQGVDCAGGCLFPAQTKRGQFEFSS